MTLSNLAMDMSHINELKKLDKFTSFSKLLKEKDVMLSKLALSQLLCLVAVKETIHEEDRWEQISDQHELENLHRRLIHVDLMVVRWIRLEGCKWY